MWARQSFELSPKVRIGISAEDDACQRRFTDVFHAVWNRIALADRTAIIGHWENEYVSVLLEDPWFGGENSFAICENRGCDIRINWPLCRLFPAEAMKNTLAHELAHVYQFAIGKCRNSLTNDDLLGNIPGIKIEYLDEVGRVELHADQTIVRWGFDPIDAFAWRIQYVRIKNGKPVIHQKPRTLKYARAQARTNRRNIYHGTGMLRRFST